MKKRKFLVPPPGDAHSCDPAWDAAGSVIEVDADKDCSWLERNAVEVTDQEEESE